ncbi:hypothetical protein M405DRAFT_824575 [Rhizopogon salebrosus TDB-379]|nr:hypothetical protein M405DRAFT_824575 [Rhizopogon salebrosus TDB-379]
MPLVDTVMVSHRVIVTPFCLCCTTYHEAVMTHPCEYLRNEDKRLVRLDNETETRRHNMRTGKPQRPTPGLPTTFSASATIITPQY